MCVAYPEPLVERLYMEIKNLLTSHVNKVYTVSDKILKVSVILVHHATLS